MRQKPFSAQNFDLFTPHLKLNLEGQSGLGTKVGSALTVIFLGAFVVMAYFIVSDFLDTSSPRVSQSVVPAALPPYISFAEDKLYPMLSFRYQTVTPLKQPELDRFVTIDFSKIEMTRDEAGTVKTTIKYLKTAACADLVAQGKLKSFEVSTKGERDLLLNGGVCVDPGQEDASLGQRSDKDPFYQQILWRVLPCTLPVGCASKEELAKVTYVSMIPKPILDLSNRTSPVRYVTLPDESMFLSTALSGRQTLNLIKNQISDDAGLLIGEKLVKSFTSIYSAGYSASDRNPAQLSCTAAQIAERSCIPYWMQSIVTGPRKMIIKRQYKGMVESFSEFGGMVDMLFMIFFFPYSIYNSRVLKEKLVEIVHGVKKPVKAKKSSSVVASRTPTSSADPLPINPQEDHYSRIKQYDELVRSIDSCFDLVLLSKEVKRIWLILKAKGLSMPEVEPANLFPPKQVLLDNKKPNANDELDDRDEIMPDNSLKCKVTNGQKLFKTKIQPIHQKRISVTNLNSIPVQTSQSSQQIAYKESSTNLPHNSKPLSRKIGEDSSVMPRDTFSRYTSGIHPVNEAALELSISEN